MKNDFLKKDPLTVIMLLLTFILTVNYVINSDFKSVMMLYLLTGVVYLLTKKLLFSLLIGILLVTIFVSGLATSREGAGSGDEEGAMREARIKTLMDAYGRSRQQAVHILNERHPPGGGAGNNPRQGLVMEDGDAIKTYLEEIMDWPINDYTPHYATPANTVAVHEQVPRLESAILEAEYMIRQLNNSCDPDADGCTNVNAKVQEIQAMIDKAEAAIPLIDMMNVGGANLGVWSAEQIFDWGREFNMLLGELSGCTTPWRTFGGLNGSDGGWGIYPPTCADAAAEEGENWMNPPWGALSTELIGRANFMNTFAGDAQLAAHCVENPGGMAVGQDCPEPQSFLGLW